MAIDTHMHVNSLIKLDQDDVIERVNKDKFIDSVINVGLNLPTSLDSVSIARKNKKFYSAVGIHPLWTHNEDFCKLYDLCDDDRVVAIGEVGLDGGNNNYEDQRKLLIRQIKIANDLHLPVIIHANNTNMEVVEVFRRYAKPLYGCVFHCFQPDLVTLKYLIDNNIYVSFAGRITWLTAKKSIEVAKLVPDDLLLAETDSPYVKTESSFNGMNESSNIRLVIKKLAEVKRMEYKDMEALTKHNAKRLFRKIK